MMHIVQWYKLTIEEQTYHADKISSLFVYSGLKYRAL